MKIKYKKSIVAFIDVLGFSNLVHSEKLTNIENYYTYIISDFQKHLRSNFKFTLISDSIVIYGDYSESNFFSLCKAIGVVQSKLIFLKILIRGGISYGNLYVNKRHNIIVGDGLIRAYKLEEEAIYPRVILDRNLIVSFSDGTRNFLKKNHEYYSQNKSTYLTFETDTYDGYLWVNYIKLLTLNTALYNNSKYEELLNFIKENYYSSNHYKKYRWLVNNIIHFLQNQADYSELTDSFSKRAITKKKHIYELLKKFRNL